MNQLLQQISSIAREAGAIMLKADTHFQTTHTANNMIQEKPDPESTRHVKNGHANFVTAYDSQVQAFLIDRLSSLLPEAAFYGEEDGMDVYHAQYSSGYTFVIDPIDGTSNFMKSCFPYVTSIGLLRDGAPFLGVVYAPQTGHLFSAARGCGAFENGVPITSSGDPLSLSLVTMGTAPYNNRLSQYAFELAAGYKPHCIDIRRSGSAAWDICSVASGRIGYYFEPEIFLHDYAAGACIAMEAGVTITDLEGNPLTFRAGATSVAAASPGVAAGPYLPADFFRKES